jgi:two-component system sensor histidine kinase VicK
MQVPESQLLQIFEKSAPCMVVKADPPEFTIIMVSDAYLQMTGLKREDIVGKGSFTVFPGRADEPSGVNSTRNAIMEVIATKKKVTIPEYSYSILNQATQELEEFWWASTFAPILNENAEVAHVLGTALDLTEQVRSRNQVTSAYSKNAWKVSLCKPLPGFVCWTARNYVSSWLTRSTNSCSPAVNC